MTTKEIPVYFKNLQQGSVSKVLHDAGLYTHTVHPYCRDLMRQMAAVEQILRLCSFPLANTYSEVMRGMEEMPGCQADISISYYDLVCRPRFISEDTDKVKFLSFPLYFDLSGGSDIFFSEVATKLHQTGLPNRASVVRNHRDIFEFSMPKIDLEEMSPEGRIYWLKELHANLRIIYESLIEVRQSDTSVVEPKEMMLLTSLEQAKNPLVIIGRSKRAGDIDAVLLIAESTHLAEMKSLAERMDATKSYDIRYIMVFDEFLFKQEEHHRSNKVELFCAWSEAYMDDDKLIAPALINTFYGKNFESFVRHQADTDIETAKAMGVFTPWAIGDDGKVTYNGRSVYETMAQAMVKVSDEENDKYLNLPRIEAREFEVWMEGFQMTGQSQDAQRLAVVKAVDFDEAVKLYITSLDPSKDRGSIPYQQPNGDWCVFACKLYDNEADARKAFG